MRRQMAVPCACLSDPWDKRLAFRGCMRSGTGILPVRLCGIGILPMIHGLEAYAT
jgi:hypothetical protein